MNNATFRATCSRDGSHITGCGRLRADGVTVIVRITMAGEGAEKAPVAETTGVFVGKI